MYLESYLKGFLRFQSITTEDSPVIFCQNDENWSYTTPQIRLYIKTEFRTGFSSAYVTYSFQCAEAVGNFALLVIAYKTGQQFFLLQTANYICFLLESYSDQL